MRNRHLSRRLIGLCAAYLVALQALILPLSMPAAADYAGGLCITAPEGGAPPAGQDHGCPCAAGCGMQCHVPALAAGAEASLVSPHRAVSDVQVPLRPTASFTPAFRGSQLPRGPPAA